MLLPIRENAFDRDQLGARLSRSITPHGASQRQGIDEVDGNVPAELQVRPGKPGNGFIPKAAASTLLRMSGASTSSTRK